MLNPAGRRVAEALARRAGPMHGPLPGADQVAAGVVGIWRDIETALSPIIGSRGVAALYGRSLYVAGGEFPWLESAIAGVHPAIDFEAVHQLFLARAPADGIAGAVVLFQTFEDLLSSMVGPALTTRLMRSVWELPQGTPPAPDTTS